jgi:hypothetical protein
VGDAPLEDRKGGPGRAVAAAVVDDDDLGGEGFGGEMGDDLLQRPGDPALLVVGANDHGEKNVFGFPSVHGVLPVRAAASL